MVILWTGFSRYESKLSLWSSFLWHSYSQCQILSVHKSIYFVIHTWDKLAVLTKEWKQISENQVSIPERIWNLKIASTNFQIEVCFDSISHKSGNLPSEMGRRVKSKWLFLIDKVLKNFSVSKSKEKRQFLKASLTDNSFEKPLIF